MENTIGKYANLTTVSVVVLAVIYASDKYDGWDLLIGIIGTVFVIKVFRLSYCDDIFSCWLAGVIA